MDGGSVGLVGWFRWGRMSPPHVLFGPWIRRWVFRWGRVLLAKHSLLCYYSRSLHWLPNRDLWPFLESESFHYIPRTGPLSLGLSVRWGITRRFPPKPYTTLTHTAVACWISPNWSSVTRGSVREPTHQRHTVLEEDRS